MHRLDLESLEPQEPMAVNEKGELVPKTLSRFEEAKINQELKDYSACKRQYEAGLEQTFGIILGQCTPGMMSKLEQRSDWDSIQDKHCPIDLLSAIREISHITEDYEYEIKSLARALRYLLDCKQGDTEGINSYTKRFKTAADLVETQCGGTPVALRHYSSKHNVEQDEAYDRLLAYICLENSTAK
jgi:hypothetical protein